jgi:hypothetical protein
VCVLQFVKSFIIYYIKYVGPRICVSNIHVQELGWESRTLMRISEKSFN